MYHRVLFVLCILCVICPAYCTDYYVATDGNDSNDGSIGHPFKTIGKAVSLVVGGDTIFLRGGQHDYSATITISKSGQDGNPITLQAYQDEVPVLDFTEQPAGDSYKGIALNGSYWHLKGFVIQYSGHAGLRVLGSYNTMERLVTRSNGDTGLHLGTGASYNLVLNCDSYLNYDPEEGGEDADGFGAKGPTGSLPGEGLGPGNVFRGCRAWNNSDDGFDLWYAGNAVRIEDCWAFRNGVNVWGDTGFTGNGQGIKLGQGAGAHIVINCMSYNNKHNGFDLNRSNGDIEPNGVTVYNCTGVKNLEKNFKFNNPTTGSIHVLRNNLSHLGSVTIGTLIVNTYNSWNGFTVTDADFASLDPNFPPITDPNTYTNANSIGIDQPRGPDGELPRLRFLRLASTSSLIDAGIDVGEPFEGDAPDLGAFEHIDGDCQPNGDVDFLDLKCLTDNWLNSACGTCNGADFDGDSSVDLYDFAVMGANWLE